jgi:acyl-[acyl-carrier-protein]-phospholipid O-acyltransferase / long-chain-fatty-acid--[acyl-carrier-protein] ligase
LVSRAPRYPRGLSLESDRREIIGDLASRHKTTYFVSTPTFCQQYAQKLEPHQFSSLKYILVGAEKLRDSIARQFASHFGIELLAGYGCTELGPGVAVNTPWEAKPGSVGLPLQDIEIRIVDPTTFAPLPPTEQGMILINGPSRMRGYYKSPELTAQAMCGEFYITGDLGFVDSDGYLYVTDRLARFSKVAGEMVPHLRIEEAVSPLTPAFVTGLPDTRRGERLILLYTNPETSSSEIHKRLQESGLPSLWIPKREDIHAIPSIPVLANGKLDLMQARQIAASIAS